MTNPGETSARQVVIAVEMAEVLLPPNERQEIQLAAHNRPAHRFLPSALFMSSRRSFHAANRRAAGTGHTSDSVSSRLSCRAETRHSPTGSGNSKTTTPFREGSDLITG